MAFKARSNRNMINCIRLFESPYITDFIVFDVETTGKDKNKDYIVQFSGIKYRIENGHLITVQEKDIYIKPPVLMDEKVVKIHGITNQFLEDKPSEKDALIEIQDFYGENPIISGYNVNFDIGMVQAMYKRAGKEFIYQAAIDVLEMARDLVEIGSTEDYKLSTIASYLCSTEGLTFHKAIDDVRATGRLLELFYKRYKESLKEKGITTKDRLYVNFLYFWKGFNKNQQGLYVGTNLGKVWLSTFNKCWMSTQVDLGQINIDQFENDVIKRTGLPFSELSKMTEKKFNQLKEARGGYI